MPAWSSSSLVGGITTPLRLEVTLTPCSRPPVRTYPTGKQVTHFAPHEKQRTVVTSRNGPPGVAVEAKSLDFYPAPFIAVSVPVLSVNILVTIVMAPADANSYEELTRLGEYPTANPLKEAVVQVAIHQPGLSVDRKGLQGYQCIGQLAYGADPV